MTRSLACDFGPRQITVNCVAPGGIKTDMYFQNAAKYLPGGENMTIEQIDAIISQMSPLGRPGYSEDVAGTVALLSSDEAQWITGQTIQCSGGAFMT
jgi:tetrahydroxynaphthalene reductase